MVSGRVAELDARLDAVEEARCQREIAVLRELVGHRLDVVIDAENLLDHDDAALGRALRRGEIGADLSGGRLKTDSLTHENSSPLRAALDMVMRRHSTHWMCHVSAETLRGRRGHRPRDHAGPQLGAADDRGRGWCAAHDPSVAAVAGGGRAARVSHRPYGARQCPLEAVRATGGIARPVLGAACLCFADLVHARRQGSDLELRDGARLRQAADHRGHAGRPRRAGRTRAGI